MSGNYEQWQPEYDKEAIEAEKDHLQALQARQEITLKQGGFDSPFARGVAELYEKHVRQEEPSWEPPAHDSTDGTRVWLAEHERSDPATRRTARHLEMIFKIPDPRNPNVFRFQTLTVGETYDGLDVTMPRGRFTEGDVVVISGLLDDMRQARAKGELPHLRDSLDALGSTESSSQEPSGS